MGQLSDESIAGKIAEQISRIVFDAPHSLRMEKEFEPLQRAALEVFREIYPNREHFSEKKIRNDKRCIFSLTLLVFEHQKRYTVTVLML